MNGIKKEDDLPTPALDGPAVLADRAVFIISEHHLRIGFLENMKFRTAVVMSRQNAGKLRDTLDKILTGTGQS
jgi:hypothetical protein